ncbi:T9SS type A sorting domain-containing protein [Ekhidna sp. To15]|uniref:T9SS type A sorting domain-containing protein n=1 Tax=Ekhidna sp. To15 TaxID=3395267 RepID=UPI003F527C86
MRRLLIVILVLIVQVGYSQLTIKPIIKPQENSKGRVSQSKIVNQASLPFWDDFSMTYSETPNAVRVWEGDSALQWNQEQSKDVYVNATLAINPPTYKVVTFDGLDSNGAFNTSSDPWADQLQSDTIDLQGKADVVLSFYWQAGGQVEIPEEGDSIRLQFYSPNIPTNEGWRTIWSMDGGDLESDQDSVFTQVAEDVESVFLTQDFVFRFQSFGDKDGPFDAWHLDYIFLDDNRADDDFYYEDISLSSVPSSPISPYNAIPAKQIFNDLSSYSSAVSMIASALEKPDASGAGVPSRYKLELYELVSSTFIDSVDFGDEPTIPVNVDPFSARSALSVETSDFDLSLLPSLDSLVLQSKVYIRDNIDTLFDPLNIDQFNDTIFSEYTLHDYYAYDDGTAEYAVGTNINGAQVAVQYWLEIPDTLTHVDIHFPNIDPISAGSALELRIFKNLNSEPIRTQDIGVINATTLNEFTRYKLSSPLTLADTFYIGYEQSKNEYIGIGFDRSNPSGSEFIYENKDGEWEQNVRLQGALMIRPVFAKVDSLVLGTGAENLGIKAYPNPTTGPIQIEGNYQSITLIDFTGRIWLKESVKRTHDFSSLKAGLYLLTIHRKEGDQTLKIIKR